MARDVTEDFAELWRFVQDYSLDAAAAGPSFREILSRQHKRYHAVLTALAELRHQGVAPIPVSDPRGGRVSEVFEERVAEAVSDLGTAMFTWMHGAYKAARLSLRSGIENFVKALGIIEYDDITTLRNVHEVFDRTRSIAFLRDPLHVRRFDQLSGLYSDLSMDVHTSTFAQMEHVAALNHFPAFERTDAQEFAERFTRAASAMLESLCLMFPTFYHSMHHRNRDVVNMSLGADARERLNRVER